MSMNTTIFVARLQEWGAARFRLSRHALNG